MQYAVWKERLYRNAPQRNTAVSVVYCVYVFQLHCTQQEFLPQNWRYKLTGESEIQNAQSATQYLMKCSTKPLGNASHSHSDVAWLELQLHTR